MALPGAGRLGGPGLPDRVRIGHATFHSNAIMEQDRFGRFISDIERGEHRLLENLVDKMKERAQRYAPYRTGRLKRSIRSVVLGNGREARVYSDVAYAGVMEEGSRPHDIHGVRANFRWKKGRFVWNDPRFGPVDANNPDDVYQNWTSTYGATVHHPGTKPHLFFSRAFHETWAEGRIIMRRSFPG